MTTASDRLRNRRLAFSVRWTLPFGAPASPVGMPGFVQAAQRRIRRPPPPFRLNAADLLLHLHFLEGAFRGGAACSWGKGARTLLFEVEDAGSLLVTIDGAESTSHTGCRVSLAPLAEPQPNGGADAKAAAASHVHCHVHCTAEGLLTMLSGSDAALVLNYDNPQLYGQFLGCFSFSGYAAFCEERDLQEHRRQAAKAEGGQAAAAAGAPTGAPTSAPTGKGGGGGTGGGSTAGDDQKRRGRWFNAARHWSLPRRGGAAAPAGGQAKKRRIFHDEVSPEPLHWSRA